jgi:hypothetical protein
MERLLFSKLGKTWFTTKWNGMETILRHGLEDDVRKGWIQKEPNLWSLSPSCLFLKTWSLKACGRRCFSLEWEHQLSSWYTLFSMKKRNNSSIFVTLLFSRHFV